MELRRVGYWADPGTDWPQVQDMIDAEWTGIERDAVVSYLRRGFVARAWLGYAKCRLCGTQLGDLDLTDGVFIWPEGLDHYVTAHGVRLPDWFVCHVVTRQEQYEAADCIDGCWAV